MLRNRIRIRCESVSGLDPDPGLFGSKLEMSKMERNYSGICKMDIHKGLFYVFYSTLLHLPRSNPGLLRLWHRQPDAIATRLDLIHKGVDDSMRGKSLPESVFSCQTQTIVTFLFTSAFFAPHGVGPGTPNECGSGCRFFETLPFFS